jgi:hypothetical protein
VKFDPAPGGGDTAVQCSGGVPAQDNEHSCQSSAAARRGSPLEIEAENQFRTPPSCNLDADHDDAPLKYRNMSEIIGPATPPGLEFRDVQRELFFAAGEEPTTFSQAEQEASWRHAMDEDIKSIQDNKTWKLVNLPEGHRPIGLKWVYKQKMDASGEVVKHKARLVAKGYIQKAGVDFNEVFAPIARLDSVRLFLALAIQEGWNAHRMDVKLAFLNGELKEEVYVVQPPGYVKEG